MVTRWVGAVVAVLAVGCGSSSATTSGSGAGASDAAPNADAAPAASDGGGATDAAGATYFGKIQFSREDQGATLSFSAVAVFAPATTLASAFACPPTWTPSGACCSLPAATTGKGSPSVGSISAGTLSLALNGAPFATLAYDPQNNANGYSPFDGFSPQVAWKDGDALRVDAQGGTIQAFSGSVAMPPALQGLSVQNTSSPKVSVSMDWTITWTPGSGAAKAQLYLENSGIAIKCSASDAAGSLTVPAALLAHVDQSAAGQVLIGSVASTTVTTPSATVEVNAFDEIVVSPTYGP